MTEPVPQHGEHVPDAVLDELKLAFGLTVDPDLDDSLLGVPDAVVDDEAIALALAAAGEAEPLPDADAPDADAPLAEPVVAEPVVVEPAAGVTSEPIAWVDIDTAGDSGSHELPSFMSDPLLVGARATPSVPATEPRPLVTDGPRSRTTIVIGAGDDDLPDPVYLDEEEPISTRTGPDHSERSTIVIGDELDSSGAFDAVDVPARSMDPRVRARRIAVKRAAGRKRLVWAAVVGGVVVVVVGVLATFSSSLFAVETVDVQGATYTSARNMAQLQAVIDELSGEPVLLVDTRKAEIELEQIPWVERAFVSTDFPNRVLIDLRERLPLATYVGSDERYRVIDRDGRVLDVLDGRPADYMLLTGTGPDLEPGALAGAPFAQAAQLVGALPAELRARTLSASVDATTGDLGLVLQGQADPASTTPDAAVPDVEVRLGNATGLDSKLARLLQQLRDGIEGVARLDVSTDEVIRSPL